MKVDDINSKSRKILQYCKFKHEKIYMAESAIRHKTKGAEDAPSGMTEISTHER